MPRIWIDYLQHLTGTPRITKIRRVFDKALRALPITQHIRIWHLYLAWAKKIGGETALKVYKRYLKVRTLILEKLYRKPLFLLPFSIF
jgi:pre-mRNA-splicing factor SYF1